MPRGYPLDLGIWIFSGAWCFFIRHWALNIQRSMSPLTHPAAFDRPKFSIRVQYLPSASPSARNPLMFNNKQLSKRP